MDIKTNVIFNKLNNGRGKMGVWTGVLAGRACLMVSKGGQAGESPTGPGLVLHIQKQERS